MIKTQFSSQTPPITNTKKLTSHSTSIFKAKLLVFSLICGAFAILHISQIHTDAEASEQAQDVHRFWSENYQHHFYMISEQ